MGIIIIILFFAAAWFLLIVPRQRELRRHQAVMAQIAAGDEVVTSSGVYGTIRSIEGEIVHLEVAPGLELKIAKRAIATMAPPPEAAIDAASVVDLTDEDDPATVESGAIEAATVEPGADNGDIGDDAVGPDRPDGAGA